MFSEEEVSLKASLEELHKVGDVAEACRRLNNDELLLRVRRMNEETRATSVPVLDAPVSILLRHMSTENRAITWARLCQEGGRASIGDHIKRTVRAGATNPERVLGWQRTCPRSRYRGTFMPPMFDDELSVSTDDDSGAADADDFAGM